MPWDLKPGTNPSKQNPLRNWKGSTTQNIMERDNKPTAAKLQIRWSKMHHEQLQVESIKLYWQPENDEM